MALDVLAAGLGAAITEARLERLEHGILGPFWAWISGDDLVDHGMTKKWCNGE